MHLFFESIFLLCLLLYITIFVNNVSNYISYETVNHPLFKIVILILFFYYNSIDQDIAILILFAYFLTIYNVVDWQPSNVNKMNSVNHLTFQKEPTFVKKIKENKNIINLNKKQLISNNKEFISKENDSNNFTTKSQFNDVQSNIVNDEAMNTEICIWKKGYSTQGIKNML